MSFVCQAEFLNVSDDFEASGVRKFGQALGNFSPRRFWLGKILRRQQKNANIRNDDNTHRNGSSRGETPMLSHSGRGPHWLIFR